MLHEPIRRRRSRCQHGILSGAVLLATFLSGCAKAPGDGHLLDALRSHVGRFGEFVRVENVRRVNGVKLPGGNGVPDQYSVEYQATLVAADRITLRLPSPLGAALQSSGDSSRVMIEGIASGHQSDPEGLAVFFNSGARFLRVNETQPVDVVGAVLLVNTDNGWRPRSVEMYLGPSISRMLKTAGAITGYWQDGFGCLLIRPMPNGNSFSFSTKAWYCEVGEPTQAVNATLRGDELKSDDGELVVRLKSDEQIVASFRYPPPNNDFRNENVTLRRISK